MQVTISTKAIEELEELGLTQRYKKQVEIFLDKPYYNSLDFKKLRGKNKGFYAFRITSKYRARLEKLDEETYYVLTVGNFH